MNFRDQVAVVTGGSGFVGSALAAWLAGEGVRVTALVRRAGAHPGLELALITQVEGEFTDPATVQRVCTGANFVVHAAATVGQDLADALHVNATGTAVLAAAARAAGCRHFVHVSTVSVYDFQSGRAKFDEEAPLRELGRTYAHSPAASPHYGVAKAEAERALWREAALGLPATALRLGAVLGVHPTSAWVVKVPPKVRAGLVPMRGQGADLMPMTHIANVVRATALVLRQPERSAGRAFNVVDEHVTWRAFLAEIGSWFPDTQPGPVVPAGEVKATDQFAGECPSDRLRAMLGYVPVFSYAEGMAEARAYWQARAS